jgi:hypothetical protein
MTLFYVLSFIAQKIFVECDTFSDQVVKAEIKYDLDEFAGQGFASDDHIDSGSGHADLSFKLLELSFELALALNFLLSLMENIIFIIF